MSRKEEPSPAPVSDESVSPNEIPKDSPFANNAATSDPDFEEKIELKYADCPEKTGFAYPSCALSFLAIKISRKLTMFALDGRNG